MSDYDSIVASQLNIAPQRAMTAAQDNPDDAAQAVALSSASGVPATTINADLDGFNRDFKAHLTDQLVRGNPELDRYINSHPLAASVSNDDWGNLDQFSRGASTTSNILKALSKPLAGTEEGAREGLMEGWGQPSPEVQRLTDPHQNIFGSLGAAASLMTYGLGETLLRSMQAGFGAVTGAVKGAATTVGGEQFGREAGALTEYEMMKGEGHPEIVPRPTEGMQNRAEFAQASQDFAQSQVIAKNREIATWLENGREPPRGISPEIDKAKAELNAKALERIEEDLANAQASATKERSPEMFGRFVDQHYGASTIGIHGDAVAELYGEKVPSPDDNILGWVPGIADQLELARQTGADIQVPVKDWISKVDPTLAKELRDNIRVWPGGITAREATEEIPPKMVTDSPLAQVRAAAGLEPMFSMGDRKLSLDRKPVIPGPFTTDLFGDSLHYYDFLDETGKKVGELELVAGKDKTLFVNMINGAAGMWANSFGPSLMRDLVRQLKDLYPDYLDEKGRLTLTGYRVSGARDAALTAGKEPPMPKPVVKLSMDDLVGKLNDYEDFRDLLSDAHWMEVPGHEGIWVNAVPTNTYAAHELEMSKAVDSEIRRISGPHVEVAPTKGLLFEDKGAVRGAYIPFRERGPVILYDLLGDDPIGTGRHESIHYLRQNGFFTPEEWDTLSSAAVNEDWIGRYHIDERYGDVSEHTKVEEAIAEGFREWARSDRPVGSNTAGIFSKLWDFLQRIKEKFAGIFGHEPTWEELFQKTQSGEIARRGPGEPEAGAFDLRAQTEGGEGFMDAYNRLKKEQGGSTVKISDLMKATGIPKELMHEFLLQEAKAGRVTLHHTSLPIADYPKDVIDNAINLPGFEEPFLTVVVKPPKPRFSLDEMDNLRANATGLDLKSFRKIQELIQERYREDVEASINRAQREQAKRQTQEWKSNRADMSKDVEASIRQRPDVATDLFLGSGELLGNKLRQRYTLQADDLTPEQKAALPKHYVSANGLPVDEVARMFGYGSGDAMVEHLSAYQAVKGDLTPQEALQKVISAETDQRMEAKYGKLGENILDEAHDQALSENNLNILHEEMVAAGMKSGTQVIDKAVAKQWVKDQFGKLSVSSVKSERFLADLGRHGRDAERALIGGDPASALVSMQAKYLSGLLAAEARKLEKEVTAFDKQAKTLSKRELNMDPEYTNYIHDILQRIGKPVRRSVQDVAEEMQARPSEGNLEKFVAEKTGAFREVPVYPELFNKAWRKNYPDLITDEFRAIRDTIKTLAWNGRDELKIEKAGEAAELSVVKAQLIDNVQQFGQIDYTKPGGVRKGLALPRTLLASHLQLENIFNRWDEFDPHGVWNQYGIRGLIEGANQERAWKKEFAERLNATKDKEDMSKTVDNQIFRQPDDFGNPNGPLIQFTRGNLRAVMLNLGNASNLDKISRGYGLKPEVVQAWALKNAKPEDWDWAQKIWDIFGDLKKRSDTMYRSLTGGVAAENIPATPIAGKAGGYYPVIWHPVFEGTSKKLMGRDPLEQENYVRATVPAGYTKSRTGYAAPMSLTIDDLPNRLAQEIHDIAMRPAVIQASKVFYDADIRRAITNHVGKQYTDLLTPYLRDVANVSNFMSKSQAEFDSWSGFIRQNLISTLVGIPTAMKHGPTALVLSMKEVGPQRYLEATKSLFSINPKTGETNYQFAMKESQELQSRDRNWQETLFGATEGLKPVSGTGKFAELRNTVMQYASKPIALSDKLSSVPTWLAQYGKAMEEGSSHGDAVYEADRAVRRAHGSTAITNRPQIMRDRSPWLTSVYNFFSDIMNRQVETLWKAGKTFDLAKDGDWDAAKKMGVGVAGGLFAYAVWPAIVEQLVSPTQYDPKDSWAKKAALSMGQTLSSSWIGVRDVVNGLLTSHDPSVGLLSTAYNEFRDVARDLDKKEVFSREHAGKLLKDGINLGGMLTGLAPAQIGKAAEFTHDVQAGVAHPRGPWGWLVGLRYGTLKKHSATFDDWMKGRAQ